MKNYNIAIAGATGAVGRVMREILEERDFPVNQLRLLASERSVGKKFGFDGKDLEVELLQNDSFNNIDIALFSAGANISKKFSPVAVKKGAVVIDNSSAFRMDPDVPLVVPEVNPDDIFRNKGIIANPNCSTIQMVVVLKPLHDAFRIRRVVVSSYQSVSGTGKEAIEELLEQTKNSLGNEEIDSQVYPHQIAFNVLPHIDVFEDNLYTKEEMKMVKETIKIIGDDSIAITATTVRVPVFVSHSESVNLELEKEFSLEDVREILSNAEGVTLQDNPDKNIYPTPINAAGKDDCFVGRVRRDETLESGLNLWIVSDNLRKGAALNAIQIAERLIKAN